ncbi:MAG: hypothetical protein ACLP22_19405 [Solirubrobacteraceae bacterium]
MRHQQVSGAYAVMFRSSSSSGTAIVPLLQERGAFREDYCGTTLREHLGLGRTHSMAT